MISFIVIGRNEGENLFECIVSIRKAIKENLISQFEIIVVDSNSTDGSVVSIIKFEDVAVYKLTNLYNAAIARNLGFQKSKGDVLFFIDGDMRITSDFLSEVYSSQNGLYYPFVSGQLNNYNFDRDGLFLNNSYQYRGVLNSYYSSSGGVFLIERKLWVLQGGMDNRFRRGQDLDFSLGLAKKGFMLYRKKTIIADHYTVSYTHKSRMWRTLTSGDVSYSNSFLIKKNFTNIYAFSKLFKSNYSLVALLFCALLAFCFYSFIPLIMYIGVLVLRAFKSCSKEFNRVLELSLFYCVRDLVFLAYLFVPLKKINESDIVSVKLN